jgi:hypothetical protein
MSSSDVDSAPVDELIQAISAAVRKFAAESAAAAAASEKPESSPRAENRKPYLEIQRYFRDDDEVELLSSSRKDVKSTKPIAVCDRQQCRCPFFGSTSAADNVDEWERFQQQQQQEPSALAAVFELVIMIGLLLWIFWLLGNVSLYV